MKLEVLNPWWYDDSWHKYDHDLTKLRDSKYRWRPSWLDSISLEPFSLNFVLGPRQVGKTTGLKILIRELIDKGRDPSSLIYINCDLIIDLKELRSILAKLPKGKALIILDEVTGLEYWWRIIKGFIDLGSFSEDVLIVSGSSSVRVKKYSESFIGRKGKGKTVEVLPLSFREFIQVKGYSTRDLARGFDEYLKLGGFPRSVNEDRTFLYELPDQVDKEISRVGRSSKISRQIISQLVEKGPSALSYSSIASEIGISHVTVREYLELLEDLFIIGIAYWRQGRKIDLKKEKKVFFRDPFIPKAFHFLRGEIREDALYEWIVQEHLFRKYGEVYYYRNGYEIDVIVNDMKIEVKAGKSHRRYPKGVKILEADDIPIFLYELGV